MDREQEDKVKKLIKEFFKKMDWEEIPQDIKIEDNLVSFNLETKTPEILIGKNCRILLDVQYLLSRIINRQIGEKIFIDFDINNYKEKKKTYLVELANNLADKAASLKKEVVLKPMPPFERRIIHLALQDRDDVKTESEGEGESRKIVIKPQNLIPEEY